MTGDDALTRQADAGTAPDIGDGSLPASRERRAATDAEARALASGLRLRILRLTLDEALTNKEIADALDRNPASVLHHVRTLVDTGFLRAEPVRRGVRGSREIPYRATGKSWYVDAPAAALAGSILEAFVTEIAAVPPEERDLIRLRISGADRPEFEKRLQELLQDFHERPRDRVEPHSVFIAIHPDTSIPRT